MHPTQIEGCEWGTWPSGTIPHSLSLPGVPVVRLQSRKYVERGEHWYRMFYDLEHKWKSRGRYSGPDMVPGHYFSLVTTSAVRELKAYGADVRDYELLLLNTSVDNLLDLTSISGLTWFYEKHYGGYAHWAHFLDAILVDELGGSQFVQYAGHVAQRNGYKGLLFFGARSAKRHWPRLESGMKRDVGLSWYAYRALVEDRQSINLCIFMGHDVVRSARYLSFESSPMLSLKNKLHGCDYSTLDQLFMSDPARAPNDELTYEYLKHRAERDVLWFTPPKLDRRSRP